LVPGRTASSPTAEMMPPAKFVTVLVAVVIAAKSIAWPPALTLIVPLLVSAIEVLVVLIRTASVLTALIVPVFEIVSEELLTVLSMARPEPVCKMLPALSKTVPVPDIKTDTVPPPLLMEPVLVTVPMPLLSVR
jgi:hypothetical protein